MSQSEGSEEYDADERHDMLHSRIPTRVIPPSNVHRSLGDPNLFPSSLHCSVDFWYRRPATITFSSIHQTNSFHSSSYHPLFLSAHTISFFDPPNLYNRSYLAVSRHFTLPRRTSFHWLCIAHAPVRAPLSLKRNDGETFTHSDLHPIIYPVQ
jgi:hypothetical protein